MKQKHLVVIIASSLVWSVGATTIYAQDENLAPSTKRIQRSFVNMDLQTPKLDRNYALLDANPAFIGTANYIPGWRTTHPIHSGKQFPMEFWRAGGPESVAVKNNPNLTDNANNQYVELNAESPSNIYQSICLLPDDTIAGSFDHATRISSTEQAELFISQITDLRDSNPRVLKHIAYSAPHTANKTWDRVSFNNISLSDVVTVAGKYEFVFQAKKWQSGYNTYGNFIDNVDIKLRPAIEFSASSGTVFENEVEQVHSINFNIVGNVTSDMTVSFLIDNDSVPNAAVWGTDYELYSRTMVNNAEVLTPIKVVKVGNNYTFDYTVKYDSELDYDVGVQVKGLVVKIKNNDLLDGDKVIPFGLQEIQTGGTVVLSTGEVCGNTPISTFQYAIKDDDTDLVVTKTLNDAEVYPSKLVSYDIVVENKSTLEGVKTSTALNVFLKDILTSNLSYDASTQVTCEVIENDKVRGTCPAISSAQQLFSTQGLYLGSMPAKAKLKFTVSNLKVAATENGANDYKDQIVNAAQVITTSNDINLSNNEAIASVPYPFLTDLSNHVTGSVDDTGKGLFYIAEGGRTGTVALLTKATGNASQVYFPLLIENQAPYTQDYLLHASKTAITTLNTSEYSELDASTITAYTSGLDIKFYLAEQGQCKADLTANVISQISIEANTSAQVCAQVTASKLTETNNPIWFAIESLQTGLGDIIKNEVIYDLQTLRQLVLVNDQQAQVNIGGTYVFSHRLTNDGSITEDHLKLAVEPLSPYDDFSYSLFLDHNNNGVLDTGDEQVNDTTVVPSIAVGERLNLLVKVQAPITATHGMRSQVQLVVTPRLEINNVILEKLINLDTIFVGLDQLVLQKTQFKRENCANMTAEQIKNANYSLAQMSIGRSDCIIYRIEANNIGAEKLNDIVINDMYPHYSTPWLSNGVLPMTDSGDAVTKQNDRVETKINQLLPGEKKSLYFGIRLQ